MSRCPFCRFEAYHYIGLELTEVPTVVKCCSLGVALRKGAPEAVQTLADMRHHSPRRKARAMKVLREYGLREPSKRELRLAREDAGHQRSAA